MAIQRYLATRDVKSARRALAVSLTTDGLVTLFLGALGLALLAYFRAHPDRIPAGGTIAVQRRPIVPPLHWFRFANRYQRTGRCRSFSGRYVGACFRPQFHQHGHCGRFC